MKGIEQAPIQDNSGSGLQEAPLTDLKVQAAVKRFAELRALGALARRKADMALRTEITASAGFIRAVVELSGTAPERPLGA